MAELCKIETGHTVSRLERMCQAVVRKAMDGDVAAFRAIIDLLEPVAQRVKGVDPRPKPNARTLASASVSKMTLVEAARAYQEALKAPEYEDDDDHSFH
jgi:hypothetical protein